MGSVSPDTEKENVDSSLEEFSPKSRKHYLEHVVHKPSASDSNVFTSDSKFFYSDQEVEDFIKGYENKSGKNYYRRDRQPKNILKDTSRVTCNSKISSRFIRYCCIHSKIIGEAKDLKDKKRKTFTNHLGCKGEISFSLSKKGDCYFISSFTNHDKHNIISKKCSKLLSQNRKLTTTQMENIQEHVQKCSKLELVSDIHNQGTQSILRDLSNVKAALKKDRLGDCMSAVVQVLKNYNATYEFKVNASNEFDAIFFTLPDMISVFECWPEFCSVDFTYKLLKLDFPVGLLTVLDGNGSTEVVCVCIVESETKDNLSWFFNVLQKNYFEPCKKIQSFMADKDSLIREVLKSKFLVPVYICSFHVSDVFRKQIHYEKMKITKQEREESLTIIQKMIYASNEENYENLYKQLCDSAPDPVKTYFDQNWHNIYKEWVRCFMTKGNYLNCTNNRHENLNGKIKLFCEKSNYLADFIKQLFDFIINIHQNERNFKALINFSKAPAYKLSTDLMSYYNYVTLYAFKFIEKEFDRMKYILKCTFVNEELMIVSSSIGTPKHVVSAFSCSCTKFQSMGLPCCHILKFRKIKACSLFDANIVLMRWTKKYFEKHRFFQKDVDETPLKIVKPGKSLSDAIVCESQDFSSHAIPSCSNDAVNLDVSFDILIEKESSLPVQLKESHENNQLNVNNLAIIKRSNPLVIPKGSTLNAIDHAISSCSNVDDVSLDIMKQKEYSLPVRSKESHENKEENVNNVVMLKRSNPLGRPKGKKLNAIGLTKKVKNLNVKNFDDKTEEEKVVNIFSWFVYAKTVSKFNNQKIKIALSDIKMKKVPCWFFNTEVNINILEPYMEKDAFNFLASQIDLNKDKVLWICDICKRDLSISQRKDNEPSNAIVCDSCLKWFHSECLALTEPIDENIAYYCNFCLKK